MKKVVESCCECGKEKVGMGEWIDVNAWSDENTLYCGGCYHRMMEERERRQKARKAKRKKAKG